MTSIPAPPHESYWSDFEFSDDDLDELFNLLLEREKPLTPREMVEPLVLTHLERLEAEAEAAKAAQQPVYRPGDSYQQGDELIFPAFDAAVATVRSVRAGTNPDLGSLKVIQVEFADGGGTREFAAELENHALNRSEEDEELSAEVEPLDAVMSHYGDEIEAKLIDVLEENDDIVRIAWRWFPRSLLANITDGHLNLAEAALDVAGGGPSPTDEMIQHIELPESIDPLLARFSLDYALQEDERFDEVGPAGEISWFLRRLEPPEVLYPPPRLEYEERSYDRDLLTESLLEQEANLNDEFSPVEPPSEDVEEVEIALLFPHWRVGALPLSARLGKLFPTAYEAPRIRFQLIDGHSEETFPGWVVREQGYVFGLDDWYRKYEVPAGGLITVRKGEAPGQVIVETADRRSRNDWIRTVAISEGGQIGFTMLKQPIGTSYDELMVVGLVDPVALDEAWLDGSQRRMSDERLIGYVFRELAKLNPQSAVHAKSLYSGVNVLRRMPPGPIFATLVADEEYEHVGDLYWKQREEPRSTA